MYKEPKICMLPEQLPQQRLRLVVDLPPRPPGFVGRSNWLDPMPERDRPKGSPRKLSFEALVISLISRLFPALKSDRELMTEVIEQAVSKRFPGAKVVAVEEVDSKKR